MLNKQKVVMNVSLVHFLFTIRLDNQINVYPYICTPPYLNNDIDYYDFRHRFNLSLEDSVLLCNKNYIFSQCILKSSEIAKSFLDRKEFNCCCFFAKRLGLLEYFTYTSYLFYVHLVIVGTD